METKKTIVILSRTKIKTTEQVFQMRRLLPGMTINELLTMKKGFPIGSIGEIVAACQQNNNQYDLYSKDGETTDDDATVHITFSLNLSLFPNSFSISTTLFH